MANLFRQTGGTTSLLPTTSWAAPNALFPSNQRNDGSAYAFTSSTSTVTLPSSGLADGYLIIAAFEFEDTSNGRHNPQGKIVQASGTGNFAGGATGGYNRDNSEDRSYVRTWAVVNNPSASATFQFQWKRDTDTPTGGTVWSTFEVIPLYYSNIGIYSSTSASLYGGTTPNQVTGFTAIHESDTAAIEISSNVVTVKGDNKRYLALGSQFFEGRGGRTQRWHGFRIDGTKEDGAKSCSYYRNGSNDESGDMFTWVIDRVTTNITLDQFCYRGDGVSNGQGGANIDGSTPSVGDHITVVIELNDSAEVFRSKSNADSPDLAITPRTLNPTPTLDFNDSASFTNETNEINCVKEGDYLFGANVSVVSNDVSTGSRFTGYAEFTLDGANDNDTRSGDYMRNNQSTTDTFGHSANLMSYIAATAGQDVGIEFTELIGSEGGGSPIIPSGWTGFWGINLDTLEDSGVTLIVQDSSHNHTAENAVLSSEYNLSVQDSSHSHNSESIVLSSSYSLTINDSSHNHTSESVVLSHTYSLVTQDSTHNHAAEVVSLNVSYIVVVNDATHSLKSDNIVLSAEYSMLVNGASHDHTVSSALISSKYSLIVSGSSHNHSAESVLLSSEYALVSQATTHNHATENIELDVSITLSVSDSNHTHTADGLDLEVSHILLINNSSHNHTVKNIVISTEYLITINSSSHNHITEEVILEVNYLLTPSDSSHSHSSENIVLSFEYILSIQDATHAHSPENIVLVLGSTMLILNDSNHTHNAEEVSTLSKYSLTLNDSIHNHNAENVLLFTNVVLESNDSTHSHTSENTTVSYYYSLLVSDSVHNHTSEEVSLSSLEQFSGHLSMLYVEPVLLEINYIKPSFYSVAYIEPKRQDVVLTRTNNIEVDYEEIKKYNPKKI